MVTTKISYQNRKITGLKLAQVIHKDLLKRHRPKHSSAAKDASIDLVITGKALGSHLELVCSGLRVAIRNGAVRLGALELGDNDLPTSCLVNLAAVADAAADDLYHLDLSGNALQVQSQEEIDSWRMLVQALTRCRHLQTLILSRNPLGDRAMEVLARCFARPVVAQPQVLLEDDMADDDKSGTASPAGSACSPEQAPASPISLPTDDTSASLVHTNGLQTLDTLQVQDANLSDAGALFLSYLIEHASKANFNVMHQPGNDMTSVGLRLLEAAERVHAFSHSDVARTDADGSVSVHQATESPPLSPVLSAPNSPTHGKQGNPSAARRPSAAHSPIRRRVSMEHDTVGTPAPLSSLQTDEDAVHHAAELLARFRVKIQGAVLKMYTEEALPVSLWQTALETVRLVRLMSQGLSATADDQTSCTRRRMPWTIWQRILIPLTDATEILSADQQRRVVEFGMSASAAEAAYALEEKLPHIKVWHMLDCLGCLAYEHAA